MSFERYIGLDVGMKRIGIAVSDPLLITAQPLKTIFRQPENRAIEEISNICKEYNAVGIISGLPINMNGSIGSQAKDVEQFAEQLGLATGIDVKFEDERLTSRQAEMYLIAQNKKPSRNKGLIDVASAVIILQQYLDRRRLK